MHFKVSSELLPIQRKKKMSFFTLCFTYIEGMDTFGGLGTKSRVSI